MWMRHIAVGLKGEKIYKIGPCSHFFKNLKVPLKLKLQTPTYQQRSHIEVIITTVCVWSDLPFPSYKTKYVKNAEKSPPPLVVMASYKG